MRQQSTVALSGRGGRRAFRRLQVLSTIPRTFRPIRFPGSKKATISYGGSLDPGLVDKLDLPGYLDEQYRRAREKHRPDRAGLGRSARVSHARGLLPLLTRYLPTLLDRKDRMSMALGLEVRVPHRDHRLVEYVFGTPWAHKTF
ncbi:asparagine synthase-related protein [Sinorhizobium psoraleae]|uniref:Asparagine synthase-related protein n=1 Tax=Sinorhizobium psoraleae TaxID=520838 RepID=A0ABT4KP11_9HYPH|nr:asparagine synthase-related protein [Sinorhizobium psoraleae]MCZ4093061.1 asparagine synthase-related protein [Sinorhizobium psoraleae]